MKPLLNIRSIPIVVEHKVTRAALRHKTSQPTVDISRHRGGLDIRSTPAKVKMDSYEMRASMGMKSAPRIIQEKASQAKQDVLDAIRTTAEDGDYIAENATKGTPIADLAMSKSIQNYQSNLTFIPSTRPEMWMEGGTLEMNYTMDKLNFDWNVNTRPQLEFIPGNIVFNIAQYNEVVIEYIGGPIYAPPSADPNYVPIDVNA